MHHPQTRPSSRVSLIALTAEVEQGVEAADAALVLVLGLGARAKAGAGAGAGMGGVEAEVCGLLLLVLLEVEGEEAVPHVAKRLEGGRQARQLQCRDERLRKGRQERERKEGWQSEWNAIRGECVGAGCLCHARQSVRAWVRAWVRVSINRDR